MPKGKCKHQLSDDEFELSQVHCDLGVLCPGYETCADYEQEENNE